MNKCLSLVHLITICFMPFYMASAQTELPQARIVNLSIDPEQVVVLHVRPGYVSSVRVLEEVSSVVLGDPGAFKAEHSEDEPQLVFFKATSTKPAQTNALITTRGGHEISLSLVSQGKSDHSEVVDYVLNCERPHSFLITSAHPSFVVGETKNVAPEGLPAATPQEKPSQPRATTADSANGSKIRIGKANCCGLRWDRRRKKSSRWPSLSPFLTPLHEPSKCCRRRYSLPGHRETSIGRRSRPSRWRSKITG